MEQLTLGSLHPTTTPRARRTDPPTSHEAARSVRNLRASQWAVLRCFYETGPMHDEKLCAVYSGVPQSVSGLRTRRHELETLGLLQDSGETTLTEGGRKTVIWELTGTGLEVARQTS